METALFKLTTASPERNYTFNFRLHLILDSNDFYLDPKNFYSKYSQNKKIPALPHYEIEILEKISDFPAAKKINFCCSNKNEGFFISWADRIAWEVEAEEIIETWTLGTVYTMIRGHDFSDLYDEVSNKNAFIEALKKNFGIFILNKEKTLTP